MEDKGVPEKSLEDGNIEEFKVRRQKLTSNIEPEAGDVVHTFINAMITSNEFNVFMAFWTVYALFADDIRVAAFYKPFDAFFFTMGIFCFVAFLFEFVAFSVYKKKYFLGIYFLLDLAALISIIPDIGWIWEPLVNMGAGEDLSGSGGLVKASKTSRAGTKASKIVRVVRLIRMIRIVKLMKVTGNQDVDLEEEDLHVDASKVGKRLTELTTQKLVMLVLTLVIGLPLLDGSVLQSYENRYQEYGLQGLHMLAQSVGTNGSAYNASGNISLDLFTQRVQDYARDAGTYDEGKIMLLSVFVPDADTATSKPNECYKVGQQWSSSVITNMLSGMKFQSRNPLESYTYSISQDNWTKHFLQPSVANITKWFRTDERVRIDVATSYKSDGQGGYIELSANSNEVADITCISEAWFDNRAYTTRMAVLGAVKTIFVMFILVTAAIVFNHDADTLVIAPLERMIRMFEKLARDPLRDNSRKRRKDEDKAENFETVILEKTLTRIAGLLRLGFGAAGADVIAENIKKGSKGELDVMVKGKKITSVFGFIKIFEFTPTVTALGSDICMYINEIAELVHTPVQDYFGFANKNMGGAFLLAWKIYKNGKLPGLRDPRDPAEPVRSPVEEEVHREKIRKQRQGIYIKSRGAGAVERQVLPQEMVDSALAAFLKIMVDIHRANNMQNTFAKYTNKPEFIEELGVNFKVELGLGLHLGWAIEGPIGSKWKIDASYLSPNVNMAARLEAATEQFHTPILLSEWLVGELSAAARSQCRRIDRVTVKGSQVPMVLYTYDINFEPQVIGNHVAARMFPDNFMKPSLTAELKQKPVKFDSEEIRSLRHGIDPNFFVAFENAMEGYISGDWRKAKDFLDEAMKYRPKDGPSSVLISVMEKTNFVAPKDWKGFRALTSK